MSSIYLRYTVEESLYGRNDFEVLDHILGERVCTCHQRKNAGLIAGLLNIAHEQEIKIQQGAGE